MLKSITINGYEIIMDDEQYNDVVSRAKALKYKDKKMGMSSYSLDDYIVRVVYRDIGKYFNGKMFLLGNDC